MSESSVSAQKIAQRSQELEVMLPDTRGVTISRYGAGNLKLGPNVITYSRLPGKPLPHGGTCPGATQECLSFCYAFAISKTVSVWDVYKRNSETSFLPTLPEGTTLVRWHVSGDFDTEAYIGSWLAMVNAHPEVTFWGYTRAWRVAELLPAINALRARPNVQLFASMDKSDDLVPPADWRRSWLSNDPRAYDKDFNRVFNRVKHDEDNKQYLNIACPEEMKTSDNCESCKYCFTQRAAAGDVTFIIH